MQHVCAAEDKTKIARVPLLRGPSRHTSTTDNTIES